MYKVPVLWRSASSLRFSAALGIARTSSTLLQPAKRKQLQVVSSCLCCRQNNAKRSYLLKPRVLLRRQQRQQKTTFSCPGLFRVAVKTDTSACKAKTTASCFKLSMLSSKQCPTVISAESARFIKTTTETTKDNFQLSRVVVSRSLTRKFQALRLKSSDVNTNIP